MSFLASMLGHPFMQRAFIAGGAVAVLCGLVGFFVVLRSLVFTGDALSHVAFTGSLGALAFGLSARLGVYVATAVVALLLAALGPRARANDVIIGSVFAWTLGLGVLFLSIFTATRATQNSTGGVSVLFGSIFGLNGHDTLVVVFVAFGVCAVVAFIARPLLFLSFDDAVARSRGVPVRILGYVSIVIVGITAAEATQAVGALLLLGLLAAPAATAGHLTTRPFRAMGLSALIAVLAVWAGLTFSYVASWMPPSTAILFVAAATYAIVFASSRFARRRLGVF